MLDANQARVRLAVVDDKTIQAILRHANVAITQQCYIKTLPAQSIAAMDKLESMIGAMCTNVQRISPNPK